MGFVIESIIVRGLHIRNDFVVKLSDEINLWEIENLFTFVQVQEWRVILCSFLWTHRRIGNDRINITSSNSTRQREFNTTSRVGLVQMINVRSWRASACGKRWLRLEKSSLARSWP
jgi:hypothetical protein